MNRRLFLFLCILASSSSFLGCQRKVNVLEVIEDVQNMLFPKTKDFPSAKEFGAIEYFKTVIKDKSFDEDDLEFLYRGARELISFGYATTLSDQKKEDVLQKYKATTFGENWLSMVMNYTIEALFCDPIYNGNKNQIGWKSFHHNAGVPRPKSKFGKSHV